MQGRLGNKNNKQCNPRVPPPAQVAAYGGSVEVAGVEAGVCTLKYKGPLPIGYGLRAAVRDKFPDIIEVRRRGGEADAGG